MNLTSKEILINALENLSIYVENSVAKEIGASALGALREECLGKKGKLTSIIRMLSNLTPDERAEVGDRLNEVRCEVRQRLK